MLIIDRLEKGKGAREEQETGLELMGRTSSDVNGKGKRRPSPQRQEENAG